MNKKQLENMQKARRDADQKLAVKLTDELEIWVDPRNYILRNNNGDVLGYFGSLVPLIWDIFHEEFKLSLKEESDLKEIIKKIDDAERYVRSLAKKLEELPLL